MLNVSFDTGSHQSVTVYKVKNNKTLDGFRTACGWIPVLYLVLNLDLWKRVIVPQSFYQNLYSCARDKISLQIQTF